VINRGFGGSEIADATHFCDRIVVPYKPRMIFFRAGGNDLWHGKSPEQVFADYRQFTAKVHAALPDTEIVWISWSPTPSRWKQAGKEKQLNELVKAFTQDNPKLGYIETYDLVLDAEGRPRPELFREDRLHLNADGYKLLADRVRPHLPELRSKKAAPGP
jgi:lysophospholipase L1-like esterase